MRSSGERELGTLLPGAYKKVQEGAEIDVYVPVEGGSGVVLPPATLDYLGDIRSSKIRVRDGDQIQVEFRAAAGGIVRRVATQFEGLPSDRVEFKEVRDPTPQDGAEFLEFRGFHGRQVHFDYYRAGAAAAFRSYTFDVSPQVTPIQILGLRFDVMEVDNTGITYAWRSIEER